MSTQSPALHAILERLERVEKQNRTLKRCGLAFLLLVGAAVAMGQARHSRTVEAEQFVVKDPQGNERAMLGFWRGAPVLNLYDTSRTLRAMLMVGANGFPGLMLYDGAGNQIVGVGSLESGPSIVLQQGSRRPLSISEQAKQLGIALIATKDAVGLSIEDTEGYSTVVGKADLVTPTTGEMHQTSAASVVLFDKDKKVIWSAP